jgi:mono/diheme cytochrome c family protein
MASGRVRLLRLALALLPLAALGWRRHESRVAGPLPPPAAPSLWPLVLALGFAALLVGGGALWSLLSRASEAEAVARALTGGDPSRAPALITRYGCGGCHAVPGVRGADGRVAPPLGGLRERVYLGGVLPNSAENLVNWIVDPRRYAPGTAMPASGIGEAEARDVAAYLYTR